MVSNFCSNSRKKLCQKNQEFKHDFTKRLYTFFKNTYYTGFELVNKI
jgi:hypothetical protein